MRLRVVTGLVLVSLLGSACGGDGQGASTSPSTQPAETVGIPDPRGDPGVPESLAYLDALSANVSKEGDLFGFAFTLSAAIPSSFEVPTPYDALLWSFCIDTDPSTTMAGYPFASTTTVPCEFIVMEMSQGGKVTGSLIYRRPLLDGKKAVTIPIHLTINGVEVLASVPAESLGSPARLTWVMATTELTLPLGNDNFADMDEVPNSSFSKPARWPSA